MVPFAQTAVEVDADQTGTVPAASQEREAKVIKQDERTLTPEERRLIESVIVSIRFVSVNDRIFPIFERTVDQFGEAQAELIGTNYIPTDPQKRVYMNERLGKEITGITETTREKIRASLTRGILADETMRDLELRVKAVYKERRRGGAKAIAITETVAAASFGALTAMKQGSIEKKMWLSSRDERVRESHRPGTGLDGQIVGINDDFVSPVTGAAGPFPGQMGTPSESINCRCAIISVTNQRDLLTEQQKTAYWKTFESERKPLERQALDAVRDGFTEQETDSLDALARQRL
jgi:uncharacterized protein with gpF-like domain